MTYLSFCAIDRIGATAQSLLIQVKLGQLGILVCGNQVYNAISFVYIFQIISFNSHDSYQLGNYMVLVLLVTGGPM